MAKNEVDFLLGNAELIIEADQQSLIQARNQALPRVDATMLYRWNGLEGTTPTGQRAETGPGQFTDWSLGVNFSVPQELVASVWLASPLLKAISQT